MAKEEVEKTTKEKNAKTKEKALTKVVIRRLPPLMTEEVFLEQIAPVPDHDYFHFVKPDPLLGSLGFSRAYINFLAVDDVYIFRDKFDGYVFLDNKGNEYVAVVEFATSQKISRKINEADSKCGTLEQDPEYLQFLKVLESPEQFHLPSAESFLEEIEAREKERRAHSDAVVSTPLVEFLKQKKVERTRLRDERREDKRRKDLDRRRQREEERFKRRDKKEDKPVILQVLKNPEREKDKEEPSTSKASQPRKDFEKRDQDRIREREKPKDKNVPSSTKFRDKKDRETNKKPIRKDDRPVRKSNDLTPDEKPREKSKKLEARESKPKREQREDVKVLKSNAEGQGEVSGTTSQLEKPLIAAKQEQNTSEGLPDRENEKREPEERRNRVDRKVRNKDRPAMQIYQPGRLRVGPKESIGAGNPTSTNLAGNSTSSSPSPTQPGCSLSQIVSKTGKEAKEEEESKTEMKTRTFKRTSVQNE